MKVVNKFDNKIFTTNDKILLFSTNMANLNSEISSLYEQIGMFMYENKDKKLTGSDLEHLNSLYTKLTSLIAESNSLKKDLI